MPQEYGPETHSSALPIVDTPAMGCFFEQMVDFASRRGLFGRAIPKPSTPKFSFFHLTRALGGGALFVRSLLLCTAVPFQPVSRYPLIAISKPSSLRPSGSEGAYVSRRSR